VESGKWKVESGKWKVESGKWKVGFTCKLKSIDITNLMHCIILHQYLHEAPLLVRCRRRRDSKISRRRKFFERTKSSAGAGTLPAGSGGKGNEFIKINLIKSVV